MRDANALTPSLLAWLCTVGTSKPTDTSSNGWKPEIRTVNVPPAGTSDCFVNGFEANDEIIDGVTFGAGASTTVDVVEGARVVDGAVVVLATVVDGAAVVAVADAVVAAVVLDDDAGTVEGEEAVDEVVDSDVDGATVVVVVVVVVVDVANRARPFSATAMRRSPD